MIAVHKSPPLLLGHNFRETDYSPSFHSMVSKVVTKIFRRKGRRKLIIANLCPSALNQEEQNLTFKSKFPQSNTNRKNSPNSTRFFSNTRKSRGNLLKPMGDRSKESEQKLQVKFNQTQFQPSSPRCVTQPHSSYSIKLYQKINQYNQCLITKTFKFQEKGRSTVDLAHSTENHQEELGSQLSLRLKKMNNTGRERPRQCFIKTNFAPRFSSLPISFKNQFKPWETTDNDQRIQIQMIEQSFEESNQIEIGEDHLENLRRELIQSIEKAKSAVQDCKIGHYDQSQYRTDQCGELIFPEYRQHINYNEQFWKKYLKNQINFAIIKELTVSVEILSKQVQQVDLSEQYQKLYKIKNRKKNRRLAAEIQKKYQCPYEKCYRFYGSDVSLNLHIKLKHGGGNKTDRQKLAEQICKAEIKGLPLPKLIYNLPKGYLEFRKNYQIGSGTDGQMRVPQI